MSESSQTSVIWGVPHERNEMFVGRDELLTELHQRLGHGEGAEVLLGLGGIGKTQVALEFAHRFRSDYTLVWWVPAQSETTVLLAYEALAARLGERISPRASAATAVEMLDTLLAPHRYLLIFDGAAQGMGLRPLLPRTSNGHVLITSREGGWEGIAHTRPMRVLSRDESVAFLRRRTGASDARGVEQVAQTLGDLPLAMEQAAALIRQSGITFNDYLRRFETQWATMLGEGLRPVDYPRSIAMTWSLAFEGVERASPAAADLLRLVSFINSDRVALSMLRDGAHLLPASLGGIATDARLWAASVAVLLNYSLVEVEEERAIGMHRLVAAVTRDRLSESAQGVWCLSAITLLAGMFRFDSADMDSWGPCGALLPHVLDATAHAERLDVGVRESIQLLNDAGRYLLRRGQFTDALAVLERAYRMCDRTMSSADPKRSSIANNLGRVLDHLGRNDEAIAMYGQAIEIDKATYGENHPHVAEVVNNYGVALLRKGDHDTARLQFQWAARVYEAHHGPDHPKMAQILNNLGNALKTVNDRHGAHEQLTRALQVAEGSVGPHHPTTARILFNLAGVMASEGYLNDAREHLERALAIDESALGTTHPNVASDCDSLAAVHAALGQPALSAQYSERVADIRQDGIHVPRRQSFAGTLQA